MKILFIIPYGGLHGSEIYLLNIINKLDTMSYKVAVFCKSPFGKNVEQNTKVKWFNSPYNPSSFLHRIKNKIITLLFKKTWDERTLLKLNKKFKPDIWYINTVILPQYALLAKSLGQPYILNVHEMPSIYSIMKDSVFQKMVEGARKTLVCSEYLQNVFLELKSREVHLLHGSINTEIEIQLSKRDKIRAELGIPKDAFVWGMAGSSSYGKGFDLFAQVALQLKNENVHFIWIGNIKDHGYEYYVKQKLESVKDKVHLLGKKERSVFFEYLNVADGFLLTSREDSFPLVMIEAAYLGKAVVAFDSGGVREFVKPGMGYVTHGINPEEMIHYMREVMAGKGIDKEKIREIARQYTLEAQIHKWESIMEA